MVKKISLRRIKIDPQIIVFSIVAIALRMLFWSYTDRIWEDSLIALASVRNLLGGLGLTQHLGEARIYSFSSPLDVLVLLGGEWVAQGINLLRIISIISAIAAIIFAGRIFRQCNINAIGQLPCLSYLACDHLQIFFGMAGMETQMATALALAVIYCSISKKIWYLGFASGLAILARLELSLVVVATILPIAWSCVTNPQTRRKDFISLAKVVVGSSIFLGPWIVFTTLYYGSPIPHTVVVKSYANGPINWQSFVKYTQGFWHQVAPFYEFWFVKQAPLPDSVIKATVAILAILALIGAISSVVKKSPLWIATFSGLGFFIYANICHLNPYFMWYLPPFIAVCFLLVAFGLSEISKISSAAACAFSVAITVAYAIHLPFTLNADKEHQEKIEIEVRQMTGVALNHMMKPGDTVFLEPLGYVGGEVRTKTVYDIPGLGSNIAFEAYKKYNVRMVERLHPDFLVLRPKQIANINKEMPGFLDGYQMSFHVASSTGDFIEYKGLSYDISGDREFFIFERRGY